MFLMVASLTMFTMGCGGDKTTKKKTTDEKPAPAEKEAK